MRSSAGLIGYGDGVPMDEPRAAAMFSRDDRPAECEGSNFELACMGLSELHEAGHGGCAHDDGCRFALEEMACNGGHAGACELVDARARR